MKKEDILINCARDLPPSAMGVSTVALTGGVGTPSPTPVTESRNSQQVQNFSSTATQDATQDNFKRLLTLYYNAMDHEYLFTCLKELVKQLTVGSTRTNSTALLALLKSMGSEPRSLKSISRNCIYRSLNRQLSPNINKLQLPTPLKEYVLEFK